MRNLKMLGLALIAMVAMSAVASVSASADTFEASSYPVTLTGSSDEFTDEFTTTAGIVKCSTPSYKATVSGATTTVTATPAYSGCTGFGFPAEVVVNECTYVFTVGAGTTGEADLECPSGKEITVIAKSGATVKCTVHVPSQTDIGGTVTYKNIGSGTTKEITLEANLTGIDYTHTAGTGLGACTGGSATNGTLVAKGKVTGENGSGHVAIFLT